MNKSLSVVLLSLILCSCANPLNRITAERYYGGGVQNQNKGDWKNAAESFRRAYLNTQWGSLSDKEAALYAYEYGRTSGTVCDWDNAKQGLDKAYELDTKIGTPMHYDLVEFALMYQAMGEYQKSKEYFSQTLKSMNNDNILEKQPIYYADTLQRYSGVLGHIGDVTQSYDLQKQAKKIIEDNPYAKPHRAIPHGQHCN
jgi:tetratricopeptide (TPR) repeat protein